MLFRSMILGQEALKLFIFTHSNPSTVKLFRAKLEVGLGVFTIKKESSVVGVVIKHSQNDVAIGSVFDLFNLVHHVVLIGEGQCSEEEEEVHSILVTDKTTGGQMNFKEKSQDISVDIRDV